MWGTPRAADGRAVAWGAECSAANCATYVWGSAAESPAAGEVTLGVANIVWGTKVEGDRIVWGSARDVENVVWGRDCGGADCRNVVWGTLVDGDNIVWGTVNATVNTVWR